VGVAQTLFRNSIFGATQHSSTKLLECCRILCICTSRMARGWTEPLVAPLSQLFMMNQTVGPVRLSFSAEMLVATGCFAFAAMRGWDLKWYQFQLIYNEVPNVRVRC
jgi:hypothetical protein